MRFKSMMLFAAAAAVFGLTARSANATTILLDLGPAAIAAGQTTNSPGNASGAWSATSPVWNSPLTNVDKSGLVDITGATVSPTVGLQLAGNGGTSGALPTNLTFDGAHEPSSSSALGGNGNLGSDYGSSSAETPETDALFQGNNTGALASAVGANITGLTPGSYTIFVTARNTNAFGTTGPSENVFANTGSGSENTWLPNPGNLNFFTTTITTTALTPDITIVTEGASSAEIRGFLNAIEIVSVPTPEPGSLGLLAVGAGMLLRRRQRVL
jgi:hypothetical protein